MSSSSKPNPMGGPMIRRSTQDLRYIKDDTEPLHQQWAPYAGPVIWTGPEGNTDYRLKTFQNWQLLGIGEVSPETTLSLNYLGRAPAGEPFPGPRGSQVGEIGWFYEKYRGSLRRTMPVEMER